MLKKIWGCTNWSQQRLLTLHESTPQSQLKPPEPTSLVVQQMEDGTAHQPVNTVQHQSKTQANSLSTPTELFLVLSTDPRGERTAVKEAWAVKRDHTRVTSKW